MVLRADLLQPVRAAAAGADDDGIRVDGAGLLAAIAEIYALADLVFEDDVLTLGGEEHFHAVVGQIVLDGQIQLLGLFGAEVADGAVHQLQARVDGVLADLLDVLAGVDALHMGVSAELEVDLVGVVDELLCKLFADEAGQVAADLIGEAQLAVGEGACTGEAGGDGAGGAAVDAVAQLRLGTVALFHRLALFHQQDLLLAAVAQQLHSGKDAGRAGTDDDQVVVVHFLFFLCCFDCELLQANFCGNGKVSGFARGPIPEGAVCEADWGSFLIPRFPARPRHSRPHGRAPRRKLPRLRGQHPAQ